MASARQRGWPPRREGNRQDPKAICRHFAAHGTCPYGTKCRFSHDQVSTEGAPSSSRPPLSQRRNDVHDGTFHAWKRLLSQRSKSTGSTPMLAAQVFQQGLKLMEGDVGTAQDAIKQFVTENGLVLIRDLVDRHMPLANQNGSEGSLLKSEIIPLFRLVTHARVVDSAFLEQEVATLFNYLFGVGGSRMRSLFGFITSALKGTALQLEDRKAIIELSLSVMSKVMDSNTTSLVNEDLPRFVRDLSDAVAGLSDEDLATLQAKKYLDYINLRLEVGSNIPLAGGGHGRPTVVREQFVLPKDGPGNLSSEGPRHDNDHADMGQIKILPTSQEIESPRAEYLPTNDSSQWHVPGIRGRLDREFRLLREDTVGQLRDAVRGKLEEIRDARNERRTGRNGLRTSTYMSPQPIKVRFNEKNGLEMLVRFQQPQCLNKQKVEQRRAWWTHGKRLQEGALVCVIDVTGAALFFSVTASTLRSEQDKGRKRGEAETDGEADQEKFFLAEDDKEAYVYLTPVEQTAKAIEQAMEWYQPAHYPSPRYLVEFPGLLLESFMHTLQALQKMHRRPDVPFADVIAPSRQSGTQEVVLEAPLYARPHGFALDLTCLASDKQPLSVAPRNPPTAMAISERTGLDQSQSAALLDAVTRKLCLIQGPPGTGKSYTGEKIIKGLIANKDKAKLGPILCVCYTNHALDQLLEHLYGDCTEKVIRIGSRSKSEKLEPCMLREHARRESRTKSEGSSGWQCRVSIKETVAKANEDLRNLERCYSWQSIKLFLEREYPEHHASLFRNGGIMEEDEDGFQRVNHLRPQHCVQRWIDDGPQTSHANNAPRSVDDLKTASLSSMTRGERRSLYNCWLAENRDTLVAAIVEAQISHGQNRDRLNLVWQGVELRCLQKADVVGVTTTGLARNIDMLRRLSCKVMVCEEAGEVLEAHLLTALLPSVEHAMLIGDHLQLRPQIQNYELQSTNPRGEQYSLDMSLFERLVKPARVGQASVPFSVLATQRRMHPSISQLIRSTLYPQLEDGGNVQTYPEVPGMRKRLFWMHHERLEGRASEQDPNATSHSNEFEAQMTVALVLHLVRQSCFSSEDIAVLTPYLGQLHRLRQIMSSLFEITLGDRDRDELEAMELDSPGLAPQQKPATLVSKQRLLNSLRVATVDNFQGEEAKVVVISLVRSNPNNKCGFLSTSNRINVLLSRAQHGMYIIGNSETYQHVPMWADVISQLQLQGNFGTKLELQCPRHPDTPMAVSEPDDFVLFAPESGCNQPCDKRLQCGHSCTGRCHSDVLHKAVKCLEPCPRFKKGCDHVCPLECGEPCHEKCQVVLQGPGIGFRLPCGHTVTRARCWETQHPSSIKCCETVEREVPGCQHKVREPCHVDVAGPRYRCRAKCGHDLPCGHQCKSECHKCRQRKDGEIVEVNHGICKQVCDRNYSTCSHRCRQACHGLQQTPCAPCEAPCEVRCSHSRCSKKCHEPCAPCAEGRCSSRCPHGKCSMPCAAPCDWVPCSKRCEEKLACGHQCPSTCGEACPGPKFCQTCCKDALKTRIVDFIEMTEYQDTDLDSDPCIFPDCGHFLTRSSMDGQMDMKAHYEVDADGVPAGIKGSTQPFSMDEIKVCADCRGPLRNVARYGRIVRRAMLDEAQKKFIAWSNGKYLELAERLLSEQVKLDEAPVKPPPARRIAGDTFNDATKTVIIKPSASRGHHIYVLTESVEKGRYKALLNLWHEINHFGNAVRREEQPFQKVADLVQFANRQRRLGGRFEFDESVIQSKGQLLGTALLLRCEIVLLKDFLAQARNSGVTVKGLNLAARFADCLKLVDLGHALHFPRLEAEGHIYFAQMCCFGKAFAAMEAMAPPTDESDTTIAEASTQGAASADLQARGLEHVAEARRVIATNPGSTAGLETEITEVERTLNNGVFYTAVSAAEMLAVYQAMAATFSGTGHWYTCRNDHPFTVGECGMPMQLATCPECGEHVGGQHHTPAAGVTRAEDIERLGQNLGNLGM